MRMPFADDSFDGIFAIEATCHAPDVVSTCRTFTGFLVNLLWISLIHLNIESIIDCFHNMLWMTSLIATRKYSEC